MKLKSSEQILQMIKLGDVKINVPKSHRYVTINATGHVLAFVSKPSMSGNTWIGVGQLHLCTVKSFGDWKTCLFDLLE